MNKELTVNNLQVTANTTAASAFNDQCVKSALYLLVSSVRYV